MMQTLLQQQQEGSKQQMEQQGFIELKAPDPHGQPQVLERGQRAHMQTKQVEEHGIQVVILG